MKSNPKVAIIHDWLPVIAGGEKVLEQILHVFPGSDVYTLFDFLDSQQRSIFGDSTIHTSYLNKLPKVKKYYRKLLPLCPQAIEHFDLSEYDLIISSSHAVAKGVITGATQTHISYVHTPSRYAWDLMHQYLRESKMDKGFKNFIAEKLLHKFRIWDYRTANGVDVFIANSQFIKKRIWKVYRREAEVIYPPVNIELFSYFADKEDFYLTASRMVPYKRIDLIAKAFTQLPELKLKIIGTGPEMEKIKKISDGYSNIELLGYQEDSILKSNMQRAKAFIFAAEEDFGIVPVEAQACGTPVIAYGAGGALETVIDYETSPERGTGLFFAEQNEKSLVETIKKFENIAENIKFENCRLNAENFSPQVFREKLNQVVRMATGQSTP